MLTQKKVSKVLLNWLDVILDYDFAVVHRPGILMGLPDALSRLYPDVVWQQAEQGVRRVRRRMLRQAPQIIQLLPPDQPLHKQWLGMDDAAQDIHPERELKAFVKERFGKECPPVLERKKLLEQYHAAGHFGVDFLFKSLWKAGHFWPGMRQDCLDVVSQCPSCIRHNVGRKGFHPLRPIVAKFPFDHIAMDLFSLHKTSPRGNNYVLVVVDVCTRFCVLRALPDKSALTVAKELWQLVADFGVPKVVQSDNGSEFVNAVVKALVDLMGVDHRLTAPYNPQANGVAEAHVKIAENCLKKMCRGNTSNFDLFLPSVQFAMNSKVSKLHGSSPAELFYGRPLNPLMDYSAIEDSDVMKEEELEQRMWIMMDLIYPSVFEKSQRKQALVAKRFNAKHRTAKAKKIEKGSLVMITDVVRSSKMEPRWVGPYKVVAITRKGNYTLLDHSGALLDRPVPRSQVKLIEEPKKPELALASKIFDDKPSGESTQLNGAGGFYNIDTILKHRGREGSREYLVRWEGFGPEEDSWTHESNFLDHKVIEDYWASRGK